MNFYSAIDTKRPVRLHESTRNFAYESLHSKYGKLACETMAISVDNVGDFETMSNLEKYNLVLLEIAKNAPIRICEEELISGSATLGSAIEHAIPAVYHGEIIFSGISHLTMDFNSIIKYGVNSYEKKVKERLSDATLTQEQQQTLESMLVCIEAMRIWHKRYLVELQSIIENAVGNDIEKYRTIYNNLLTVPFNAATNFYEAVQSLWFSFAFIRLCGNWPGIGRIDGMLGDYLKKDLEQNKLTINEAREILAHFFIKGCEWIKGNLNENSGDAMHYQNIILSGIGNDGNNITNDVTYLVLEIVEELGISDFPIAVRINQNTEQRLFTKMAEVIRHGGGIVAVYNEDLILRSLMNFGYPKEEAIEFANDGCWEIQIPGKTFFAYHPFDSLEILQKDVLKLNINEELDYSSYDELYNSFVNALSKWVEEFRNKASAIANSIFYNTPCSIISLFTEGCIESAKQYNQRGPKYTVVSPHMGGLPDVGNSLYAIKKLVFEEKKISLNDFINIVRKNWQDSELLRQYVLNQYSYFGNDNDEVDYIVADILDKFMSFVRIQPKVDGILCPPGVSTFGRQIEWIPTRTASPHGRKQGEILAGNFSPTPSTDKDSVTAIIKSHCKSNLENLTAGTALDIKLYPTTVTNENGKEAIISLIKAFVALGGFFMQMDVIDNAILKEAKLNPEKYGTLAVRVSGWSARFVTLNDTWKDMIIERSSHNV